MNIERIAEFGLFCLCLNPVCGLGLVWFARKDAKKACCWLLADIFFTLVAMTCVYYETRVYGW